MPSAGAPRVHSLSGITGIGERKHAPTSVPPERLMIGARPSATTWCSQRYGSGFQGSPVEPSTRSDERSWRSTGSSPCGCSARIRVGETPSTLIRWRSTMSHRRLGPG